MEMTSLHKFKIDVMEKGMWKGKGKGKYTGWLHFLIFIFLEGETRPWFFFLLCNCTICYNLRSFLLIISQMTSHVSMTSHYDPQNGQNDQTMSDF